MKMMLKPLYDFVNPYRTVDKLNMKLLLKSIPQVENVLDLGCGRSPLKSFFRKRDIRYFGADILPLDNVDFLVNDEGDLINCDLSFDLIYSSDVLSHIKNRNQYFQTVNNYLIVDGYLLIDVLFIYSECDFEDYSRWSEAGIVAELEQYGFSVECCLKRGGAFFSLISVVHSVLKNLIFGSRKNWREKNNPFKMVSLLLVDAFIFPLLYLAFGIDRLIGDNGAYLGVSVLAKKTL